jgi:hypothetical protein
MARLQVSIGPTTVTACLARMNVRHAAGGVGAGNPSPPTHA